MRRFFALVVATWFGSGLIPPIILKGMAGTYGSLAALPICYLALLWLGATGYIILTLAVFLVGVWSIPIAEIALGPRKDWRGHAKDHDQNEIVIDEVIGMLITCMPLLWIRHDSWVAYPVAFGLFRLFDITKPQPIGFFDRMQSATGVMLDDVVAGVYAAVALVAIIVLVG